MSNRHQQEILDAAKRAAIEAASGERQRCLWVLGEIERKAQAGLDAKFMGAADLQLAKVRMELTKAIVAAARTLILTGVRPAPKPPTGGIVAP